MNSDMQMPQTTSIGDYIGSLFTILLSLAFIIVLIVLFIKLLSRKNRLWQMNQSIRTLGGTGIGQNKTLQVVEVGETIYLLGVGEDITLIDKVSDPEQVSRLLLSFEEADRQASISSLPVSISDFIRKVRDKRSKHASADTRQQVEEANDISFHEMFHAKLEQLPDRQSRVERLWDDDNKEDR